MQIVCFFKKTWKDRGEEWEMGYQRVQKENSMKQDYQAGQKIKGELNNQGEQEEKKQEWEVGMWWDFNYPRKKFLQIPFCLCLCSHLKVDFPLEGTVPSKRLCF